MADNWTTPLSWAAGNLTVSNLNIYVRDNMDALKAGLTDSSADADITQAVKAGTLAARPSGVTTIGRQYIATDIRHGYWSDGATWRHAYGPGAYDSFQRASSTNIGSAESGHVWTESLGDVDIITNDRLHGVTLAAGVALATVDTGAPIVSAEYHAQIGTNTVAASINVGICLKYLSGSTHLYVQLLGSTNQMRLINNASVVGTAVTPSPAISGAGNYILEVSLKGSEVVAKLSTGTSLIAIGNWADVASVITPYVAAQRCGPIFGSSGANSDTVFGFGVSNFA